MRLSAVATSSIGTSVSMTGSMPSGHLVEALGDVAHGSAERSEDAVLLLEQLHQIDGGGGTRRRAAGHEPTSALQRQQRAVEGIGADMLEHHVDAFLSGDLAGFVLETIVAVVDDVVGAERLDARDLAVVADGGDDGAADLLGHHDRNRSDAGAAGMHQHGLARLQSGIVEQHVLHRRERNRRAGRVASADAARAPQITSRSGRLMSSRAKAVDMEAHDAGHVLAEIVAALACRHGRSRR